MFKIGSLEVYDMYINIYLYIENKYMCLLMVDLIPFYFNKSSFSGSLHFLLMKKLKIENRLFDYDYGFTVSYCPGWQTSRPRRKKKVFFFIVGGGG